MLRHASLHADVDVSRRTMLHQVGLGLYGMHRLIILSASAWAGAAAAAAADGKASPASRGRRRRGGPAWRCVRSPRRRVALARRRALRPRRPRSRAAPTPAAHSWSTPLRTRSPPRAALGCGALPTGTACTPRATRSSASCARRRAAAPWQRARPQHGSHRTHRDALFCD